MYCNKIVLTICTCSSIKWIHTELLPASICKTVNCNNMSHVMRKPAYDICEQQRRRSACASAQSDSTFVVRCLTILSQSYKATVFYFDNISFLEHVSNQLFLPNESSISQASYRTMVLTIYFQLFRKQTILRR